MGKYIFSNGFATSPEIEFENEEAAIKACEKEARLDNTRTWLYEVKEDDKGIEIGYAAGYGEWKFVRKEDAL
jgi:hypothetical protein